MAASKHPVRKVQSVFKSSTPVNCKECYMSYFPHIKKDVAAHKQYHMDYLEGPKWLKCKSKLLKVVNVKRKSKSKSVELISMERSKDEGILLIMRIVNNELNAVSERVQYSKNTNIKGSVFMAVLGGRVIAICTTEPIINPKLQCRWMEYDTQEILLQVNSAIKIGISRIWVAPSWRRHGLALLLLDAVRRHTIYGVVLDRAAIAFSQPTSLGSSLARSYNGRVLTNGKCFIPVYLELEQTASE